MVCKREENQKQLLGQLIFPIPSKQWRHSSEALTDPQESCLLGGFLPLTFQGQADTKLLLFSFLKKPNPRFLRAKAKLASSPPPFPWKFHVLRKALTLPSTKNGPALSCGASSPREEAGQPSLSPGSKGTTRTKPGLLGSLRRQRAAGKASQQQTEGESCFPQQLGMLQTGPKHTRVQRREGSAVFCCPKRGERNKIPYPDSSVPHTPPSPHFQQPGPSYL